jgi:hypothetical protein
MGMIVVDLCMDVECAGLVEGPACEAGLPVEEYIAGVLTDWADQGQLEA